MNVGIAPIAFIKPKSMRIDWEGISTVEHTGGDPVIYYELQWLNYLTEEWEIITTPTESPAYQHTFTRDVIFPSASDQHFRLRA